MRGRQLLLPAVFVLGALLGAEAAAQTGGLGLEPARLEVEMAAGGEKTVAFQILTSPSDQVLRGRLLLSLTDWNIKEDGSAVYTDPGTQPNSASAWIVYSPAAVTVSSGEGHMVRVTITVPAETPPGDYRTAIFIQERPPATPPKPGERLIYLRFRYVFTLYVMVPPISGRGELADIRIQNDSSGSSLVFELINHGSRHLRPYVSWSVRNADQQEVSAVKQHETTVLLAGAVLKEPIPMGPCPGPIRDCRTSGFPGRRTDPGGPSHCGGRTRAGTQGTARGCAAGHGAEKGWVTPGSRKHEQVLETRWAARMPGAASRPDRALAAIPRPGIAVATGCFGLGSGRVRRPTAGAGHSGRRQAHRHRAPGGANRQ